MKSTEKPWTKKIIYCCPVCGRDVKEEWVEKLRIITPWAKERYFGGRGNIRHGRKLGPTEHGNWVFEKFKTIMTGILEGLYRDGLVSTYHATKAKVHRLFEAPIERIVTEKVLPSVECKEPKGIYLSTTEHEVHDELRLTQSKTFGKILYHRVEKVNE